VSSQGEAVRSWQLALRRGLPDDPAALVLAMTGRGGANGIWSA